MWRIFLSIWSLPGARRSPSSSILLEPSPKAPSGHSRVTKHCPERQEDLMFSKRAWLARHPVELMLAARHHRQR